MGECAQYGGIQSAGSHVPKPVSIMSAARFWKSFIENKQYGNFMDLML